MTTPEDLQADGVRMVVGTMVNAAGLTLAKSVPLARFEAFVDVGLGAAPVWDVFAVDGSIAFTGTISAVGDRRLRLDRAAVREIGGGRAWGPTDVVTQDGAVDPHCTRTALRRQEERLAELGLGALVGHELEFALVGPDGSPLPDPPRLPYGLTPLLDHAAFVDDLMITAAELGLALEQLHAEYGAHQLELSLPPLSPVAAADQVVVTKIVVGVVARRHGLRASFSPVPFAGAVGNGAHQHLSLRHDREPVFSGGDGPHGLTPRGAQVIAGLLDGLAQVQGILGGSVLSGTRLAPGSWSGAARCWGLENREAAVRFLAAGPANPHGANVEIKIIDPSANVYLATAAVLALAAHGIEHDLALPAEVAGDPSTLDESERAARDITVLPTDPGAVIDALDRSALVRERLGDAVVDAVVAVRRLEQTTYADVPVEEVVERLRLTWSV